MKTCFKCNTAKERTEFYKHPQMADGLLGKCKECTKKDTAKRVAIKVETDLEWVLAERERCRIKASLNRKQIPANQRSIANAKYKALNPHKQRAKDLVAKAIAAGTLQRQPCVECGAKAQAHHDDYTKPLDVTWLCSKHHAAHHVRQRDAEAAAKFAS